jgi:hypothetical protein
MVAVCQPDPAIHVRFDFVGHSQDPRELHLIFVARPNWQLKHSVMRFCFDHLTVTNAAYEQRSHGVQYAKNNTTMTMPSTIAKA